ncbi:MAG: AbrB/MazE/SpoVT family DNA-binding domain-containing protein [Beijerinckiaceae bacterium]
MKQQPKKSETSTHVLQIRKIGNSTGVILPKELLLKLGLKEGDKLSVIELSDRGLQLSSYDPDHAETMAVAREIMDEYKDTFRELAK